MDERTQKQVLEPFEMQPNLSVRDVSKKIIQLELDPAIQEKEWFDNL